MNKYKLLLSCLLLTIFFTNLLFASGSEIQSAKSKYKYKVIKHTYKVLPASMLDQTQTKKKVKVIKKVFKTFKKIKINSDMIIHTNDLSLVSSYPSPASGYIFFNINSNEDANARIDIFTIYGEKINTIKTDLHSGDNLIKIDLSEFHNGSYYFKLTSKSKIISGNFIVAN